MKQAFSIRNESGLEQWKNIQKKIGEAKANGRSWIHEDGDILEKDVVKKLLEKGFTVRMYQDPNNILDSYYEILWNQAVKGKRGILKVIKYKRF